MIPKYVRQYIQSYKDGDILLNEERKLLIEHLELNILYNDELYFDMEQIKQCIKFIETFFFPLQAFQKFLICFIFLFEKEFFSKLYKRFDMIVIEI